MKKHNYFKKTLGYLIIATTMVGCVSSRGNIDYSNTDIPDSWQLQGKIGIVYPKKSCRHNDCQTNNIQGKINWKQQQQNYTINLIDPFGRTVMLITGDDNNLTADTFKQEPIHLQPKEFITLVIQNTENNDLSELSPQWLKYWVTGRPVPNIAVNNKVTGHFQQQGYSIDTRHWRDTNVGKMPSLITITKNKFKLRLVIKDWKKI